MKIANKITLSFFATALILTSTAGTIFYRIAKDNLQNSIYNNLITACCFRSDHIKTYLKSLTTFVGELSKSAVLENLLKIKGKENPQQGEAFAIATKRLARTEEVIPAIAEFLLLDATGKVVASSNESSVGLDKSTDTFFLNGQKEAYIKDVYYSELLKEPLIAVSAPFLDSQTGELLGVLVAQVRLTDLNNIAKSEVGMGKTGEIYIVNKYGFMITSSRFKEDVVLKQKVDTENTRQSWLSKDIEHVSSKAKGEGKVNVFPNYCGVQVLGANEYMPQMQWTVLAEINVKEAFAPLAKLRLVFLTILFIVPLAAGLFGVHIAKLITNPLHRLHKGTEIIGAGNLDYKVGIDAKDEVGQLSRAIDKMAENLKSTTTSIKNLSKEIFERKKAEQRLEGNQEELKRQAQELNAALREALKSREILLSMLTDNNQIREKLEQYIEDLKRAQNMLIQSEKMASLGKLVSSMAHEVNNPLMIISGNAQLSLMEGTKEEEIKNNLKIIMGECLRAKNIIQRLLTFSRPSKGETKEADINKSLEAVVVIMEHQFKLVNLEIKRNYLENLPLISIDEQQMQEVFMNLINNAVEAMPGGGVVTIATYLEGDFLRLDFKDTGLGMTEEVKKKVFEPFFTTKEKGTGLGLAVCYGIIKAHNGELKFESGLNKGTTATILLPLGGG